MTREKTLEALQEQFATFRRRAEPGLTRGDILTRLHNAVDWLELHDPGNPDEELIGDMLIDLCCLAQREGLDLAHHGRQAFRRMQQEYEAGQ